MRMATIYKARLEYKNNACLPNVTIESEDMPDLLESLDMMGLADVPDVDRLLHRLYIDKAAYASSDFTITIRQEQAK
jgi:hypothetical protein